MRKEVLTFGFLEKTLFLWQDDGAKYDFVHC